MKHKNNKKNDLNKQITKEKIKGSNYNLHDNHNFTLENYEKIEGNNVRAELEKIMRKLKEILIA